MRTTPFRQAEAEALAAMTPDERARFDAAEAEEETRLQLAELVYAARTRAGLTQTGSSLLMWCRGLRGVWSLAGERGGVG